MHTQQLLLSCLLFLNEGIGFKVQRINEHCVLINSGSTIDICNRVLHTGVPTYDEIALIKKQFAGLPFSWPMNPDDEESSQLLKEHGFIDVGDYPAMAVDIADVPSTSYGDSIHVKEIFFESDELEQWATILTESFSYAYGKRDEVFNMLKFFQEQVQRDKCALYLAYYDGRAAACGLVLMHGDIASLHVIATLQEFRNKRLGSAVTHALLLHAKQKGCKRAILLASALGRPVYERLGFKEYALYKIYVGK